MDYMLFVWIAALVWDGVFLHEPIEEEARNYGLQVIH